MVEIIPSVTECFTLMDKYEMYENIRAHSKVVAGVASCLHTELGKKLPPQNLPDQELVVAGALLHDIAKTPCLKKGCRHAEFGIEICLGENLPSIGEIVGEHVVLSSYSSKRCYSGIFSAKELVYYADKRVKHDEIVDLDDRLDYILENYGQKNPLIEQRIRLNFAQCVELERSIFSFLDISPEGVKSTISHS